MLGLYIAAPAQPSPTRKYPSLRRSSPWTPGRGPALRQRPPRGPPCVAVRAHLQFAFRPPMRCCRMAPGADLRPRSTSRAPPVLGTAPRRSRRLHPPPVPRHLGAKVLHPRGPVASQAGPEGHEAPARAVWRSPHLCALPLRCPAEEAAQDRGAHRRGARLGPATASPRPRPDRRVTGRFCRHGRPQPSQGGRWDVEPPAKGGNCATIASWRSAWKTGSSRTPAPRAARASDGRCRDRPAPASTPRCQRASRSRCQYLVVDARISRWRQGVAVEL